MEIPKLTILKGKQIYGDNKLKIFNVLNSRAAVSDTAILRGAYITDNHVGGKAGCYWLQDLELSNFEEDGSLVHVSFDDGHCRPISTYLRTIGIRLSLPASFISSNTSNIIKREDGLQRAYYGYYPCSAVDKDSQINLKYKKNNGVLCKLGKGCTFDGRKWSEIDEGFLPEEQIYYGDKGNIYANIRANSDFNGKDFTLSNNQKYNDNDFVWTKIEPVIWLRHPEDDVFISELLIIAGIRFNKTSIKCKNFSNTELKWFLDNHLSKDLINPIVYDYFDNYQDKKGLKENVNNFIFEDKDSKTVKKSKRYRRY